MPIPNEHAYLAMLYRGLADYNWCIIPDVDERRLPDGFKAPVAGVYRWSKQKSQWLLASRRNRNGYRRIPFRFNGRRYEVMEHLLIWLYVTAEWPTRGRQVNHKNMDRSDNSINNLELATQSANLKHAHKLRKAGIPGGKR